VLEESIKQRIESLRLNLLEKSRTIMPRGSDRRPIVLAEIENLRETRGENGRCVVIEGEVDEYLSAESLKTAACRLLGDAETTPPFLFLDLETTGFSSTPLFLAGTIFECRGSVRSLQFLARDYSEEKALIGLLDELMGGFGVCITFNGKSFDIPYLVERARYHRIDLVASPLQFDLLHVARRRWRNTLPNCRLVTLEWHILGRRRVGDVPGWEVPCIYHEFVHTKNARKLRNVLRHNLIDVVSMAQLFISLGEAAQC
jgi:uncharacterized protein YprB with RNaseH-like and TPR domain